MRRPIWLLAVLALLTLAGVAALVMLRDAPRSDWGYVAAATVFIASTLQAAPPLALASRLAHGAWGVPARRLAELCGVCGVISAPLTVLLLTKLPDWHLRPSVWLDWPGAPLLWDTVAAVILALSGLALALFWRVQPPRTLDRWRRHELAAAILGTLFLMALVFDHLLLSSDLAMSLVPGWGSPNFAAYQAVTALQGGAATTVLLLAMTRSVPDKTYHALGKILLALSLLWFYFTWSELLTYWYGRTPAELELLQLLMFGPTLPLFLGAAIGCFLVPVALLISNQVRNSVRGPTVAAGAILLGLLLDRLRVYVTAWAVAGPVRERLEEVPVALPLPSVETTVAMVGILAAALFVVAVPLAEAA